MSEPRVIYGPTVATEDNHHWRREPRTGDDRFVRTNRAYIARHPNAVIRWLEPRCCDCRGHAPPPKWCEDEGAWDCPAILCNARPTPYRRENA